jgi:hypothetical protein
MSKPPTWLEAYKHNLYSQSGEDGVLAKVLELLPERDRWCVEFGAWDGKHLSNTRALIEQQDYAAVLIEGDRRRHFNLQRNFAGRPNVIALHALVGFAPDDNLDTLLQRTPIPQCFDLLSIDIDGFDYHVWRAVSHYQPKVVCIEFNPTIPPQVSFAQPADTAIKQGASLSALADLGRAKGYELVSVLTYNAIFVRAEYFSLFEIADNSPATLWTDTSQLTYIFSGYDGRVFLSGFKALPWHAVSLTERQVQGLPWFLRQYPEDMSVPKQLLLLAFRAWAKVTRGYRRRRTT